MIEVSADAPGVPSGRENMVYRGCEEFFRALIFAPGSGAICESVFPRRLGWAAGAGMRRRRSSA